MRSRPSVRDHVPSRARLLVARLRMPLVAAGAAIFIAAGLFGLPEIVVYLGLALFVVGFALYTRLGKPVGRVAELASPVEGRWTAMNSPSTRVPSHGIHAWGQTYAIDLVHDPADGSRPGFGLLPVARRPADYPGFGRPVLAPIDGEVVRIRQGWRDHWTRTSPLGLLYLVLESVRELAGPSGVVGNHLVIRAADGTSVLLAHLRRHSLLVDRGDRVTAGQPVAACGNSGNSTEPHLHMQVMDRPSAWIGSARPFRLDGHAPPPNGELLEVTAAGVAN